MIGVGFSRTDWMPLFSNSATAAEIFQRNAGSKRLEVAWIGFDETLGGWFFRLNRGGKPIVCFAQGDQKEAEPQVEGESGIEELVAKFKTGKSAFKALCQQYDVPVSSPEVTSEKGKYLAVGVHGKTIKGRNWGIINYQGPEMAAGENPAADQLEEAIEELDVDGVRAALEAGAPVDVMAESSSSPLVCALYQWEEPDGQEIAKLLLQYGANVNGREGTDPPLVDINSDFVFDDISYEGSKFLLEHGARVDAKNSFGKTALYEAVVNKKWNSTKLLVEHGAKPGDELVDWVRDRIERDFEFNKQTDYVEYLTLLTGETVELPEIEELSPELQAENARFAQCIQMTQALAMLEGGIDVRRDKANELAKLPESQTWISQFTKLGFEEAGPIQLALGWNIRPSISLVHTKKNMEAIITVGGPQMDHIRVDIGVYHPGEEVTCVGNKPQESFLGLKTPRTHFTHVEVADAQMLVDALESSLAESKRDVLLIDVESFLDRYRLHNEQILGDLKTQIAELLAKPAIFVDGKPARFEKLKCYLDYGDSKDPTWSTSRIVEGCEEDVDEALEANPKEDDWTVKGGIRGAYGMAAARYMQYAGAPKSTEFLTAGCQAALKYFQYQTGRSKPYDGDCYIEELEQALLLAVLADDWTTFAELCETMRPHLASSKVRMPDDPPEEEGMVLLVMGSTFRAKKIKGVDKFHEKIRKSRKKRCHFLLDAWEAIEQENWEAFQKALTAATKKHITRTSKAKSWYEMSMMIAKPESILWAIARQRGMPEIELAEEVADRIITPETIST
ncbi:hypothetical protein C5Y93_26865 [Blastopirellula marina]|uniref:Uncharacterized protein n=2 Tax=Blastopirellula marina TaxID=124 RepID=A0A2S8GBZ9_9BACT|nr:hypothetical protein C5Y93_26865 [Blastopirellula marina]